LKNFGTLKDLVQTRAILLRNVANTLNYHNRKKKVRILLNSLQLIKYLICFHKLEYLNGQEFHLANKKPIGFRKVSLLLHLKQERQTYDSSASFMELKKTIMLQRVQQKLNQTLIILMRIKVLLLNQEVKELILLHIGSQIIH